MLVVVLGLVAFAPPTPAPTVVAGAVDRHGNTFRFWSDGMVGVARMQFADPQSCDLNGLQCPPQVVIP